MNWAHLHLMIKHFPVVGLLFGFLLLLLSIIKKSEELKRVSLWILVVVSLIALPVYMTGESAEDMVKNLVGVSDSIIEQHEEMAKTSLIAVILLGVTAVVGLFFFRHSAIIPGLYMALLLAISIIAGGLMGKTANLGGQIRHPEVRKDFQLSLRDVKIQKEEREKHDD